MNDQHIAFSGEVQLLNWSETHSGGAKVTLQLADAADLERFKAMTVRKGKMAGQRLAVVMVEIGDDEQPVEQESKPRVGDLCIMACTFCADREFWKWAGVGSESEAKARILEACGIKSRKDLDTNADAARNFQVLVRQPFMAWRAGR